MKTVRMTEDSDLYIANGRASFLEGSNAAAQILTGRFRAFRGEWFLGKTTVGFPYFDEVLVHNPEGALIASLFKSYALASPGIDAVEELTLDLDPNDPRGLIVNLTASSEGDSFTLSDLKAR